MAETSVLASDEGDEHADSALQAAPDDDILPAHDEAGLGDAGCHKRHRRLLYFGLMDELQLSPVLLEPIDVDVTLGELPGIEDHVFASTNEQEALAILTSEWNHRNTHGSFVTFELNRLKDLFADGIDNTYT
ncbi:hypothetical protein HG530_011814 [Fusarium avenaceum]|nr:hypothetical protein HG530_011814 [Fusarium avenaceum]